eukprot:31421-Pelagococcus_subviridis.AAC.1
MLKPSGANAPEDASSASSAHVGIASSSASSVVDDGFERASIPGLSSPPFAIAPSFCRALSFARGDGTSPPSPVAGIRRRPVPPGGGFFALSKNGACVSVPCRGSFTGRTLITGLSVSCCVSYPRNGCVGCVSVVGVGAAFASSAGLDRDAGGNGHALSVTLSSFSSSSPSASTGGRADVVLSGLWCRPSADASPRRRRAGPPPSRASVPSPSPPPPPSRSSTRRLPAPSSGYSYSYSPAMSCVASACVACCVAVAGAATSSSSSTATTSAAAPPDAPSLAPPAAAAAVLASTASIIAASASSSRPPWDSAMTNPPMASRVAPPGAPSSRGAQICVATRHLNQKSATSVELLLTR